MRLHIALGVTSDGDYTSLYLGDDAAAAIQSIQEAGKKGKIVYGLHLKNPHHAPHKRYRFPQNVTGDKAIEPVNRTAEASAAPAKKTAKKTAKRSPANTEPGRDADHFNA